MWLSGRSIKIIYHRKISRDSIKEIPNPKPSLEFVYTTHPCFCTHQKKQIFLNVGRCWKLRIPLYIFIISGLSPLAFPIAVGEVRRQKWKCQPAQQLGDVLQRFCTGLQQGDVCFWAAEFIYLLYFVLLCSLRIPFSMSLPLPLVCRCIFTSHSMQQQFITTESVASILVCWGLVCSNGLRFLDLKCIGDDDDRFGSQTHTS